MVRIDEQRARVVETRRRLARDGPPRTRGPRDFETVTMPERDCDLLRDVLVADRVETVVEVGLAYGSSALAIGEALVTVARPAARHVVVDPFQETAWANAGWEVVRAAGLDRIARLVREPSSSALCRLVDDRWVADAAFVDGSHRFHEVFVDLYFLRKIVRPGGLIILDDHSTPSVRTAARYFEQNLGWASMPDAFRAGTRQHADAEPASRCMAFRLPDPAPDPPFHDFRPF